MAAGNVADAEFVERALELVEIDQPTVARVVVLSPEEQGCQPFVEVVLAGFVERSGDDDAPPRTDVLVLVDG